ncbi:hypothetical protein AN958_03382 [Leucoagaricus sp. SymC.cos]|nr:hypothetical protein AN958_03382 [Leucoagaricus sp. SymC.cos]
MAGSTNSEPLWLPRLGALAMTWAWSIIAFGTAINAVVKSKHDKDRVRSLAPRGSTVDIDDNDVFQTGAVITAICIVLFVITSIYIVILLLRPASFSRRRTIAIQGGILAFFATWLFATLVPYTHFVRTRSAVTRVTIGGVPLSQTVIDNLERQFGITPVYKRIGYLRLVAILPWITLLFTIISSVLLYMAASRSSKLQHTQPVEAVKRSADAADTTNEKVDSPTEKVDSSAA